MSNNKINDVVILGGGIFGFSIAYHLSKEGISSQVIEMDSIGAKASGKSDGMIPDPLFSFFYAGIEFCPGGFKKVMVPFMAENYHRMQLFHLQITEETGLDVQHANSQFLTCALSEIEEKGINMLASEARKEGFEVNLISGEEARELEPTVTPDIRAAVLMRVSQIEPYRFTLAMAQGAEKLGAGIRLGQATGFRREGDKVTSVTLSTGDEVGAEKFVIAMGPWSAQAVSWLGLKLPVTPFRAETLKMEAPKLPTQQMAFMPPTEKEWPHIYMVVSPRVDGSLYMGYTEDRPEDWDDNRPETWTDIPSAEMRDLMMEHAIRFVPFLEDALLVEHRAAVLANPPGEGIVLGPVLQFDNVYMATVGDNGMCVSLEVGRIITDLIVGGDRAKQALETVKEIRPAKFIS